MRGVSARDQELIGQIGALKAAGAQTIFREKNRLNQSAENSRSCGLPLSWRRGRFARGVSQVKKAAKLIPAPNAEREQKREDGSMRIVVPTNKGSRFGFEILNEFLTHKRRPAEVPDRGGARKDELKSLRSAGEYSDSCYSCCFGDPIASLLPS